MARLRGRALARCGVNDDTRLAPLATRKAGDGRRGVRIVWQRRNRTNGTYRPYWIWSDGCDRSDRSDGQRRRQRIDHTADQRHKQRQPVYSESRGRLEHNHHRWRHWHSYLCVIRRRRRNRTHGSDRSQWEQRRDGSHRSERREHLPRLHDRQRHTGRNGTCPGAVCWLVRGAGNGHHPRGRRVGWNGHDWRHSHDNRN